MTFHEWKQRSRAYRKAVASVGDDREAKKTESLCRAAFTAGVDWGLETYEAKVGARKTAKPIAWIRFCSDGGYEGPIADCDKRMDDTRRKSGAWTPLFATHNAELTGDALARRPG